MNTLIISQEEIATIVDHVGLDYLMNEVIQRLTQALLNFDEKAIKIRKRDGFVYKTPHSGTLEWMPVMRSEDIAVVKIVSYNPTNPTNRRVPTVIGTISIYDIRTGHLLALMDGTFTTALRTGAASAVASKILAHPESKVVGLIGCGTQAISQLHALSLTFHIERVLIFDADDSVAQSFLKRSQFLDLNVSSVAKSTVEQNSDIICTATSVPIGEGLVLEDLNLKSHVHLNAVGSDLPGKIELPLSLLKRALVCPDFWPQALVEGECSQIQEEDIGPTLEKLVKNQSKYQSNRYFETVFDSTGFALEDLIVAEVIWEITKKLDIGKSLAVELVCSESQNPYSFLSSQNLCEKTTSF